MKKTGPEGFCHSQSRARTVTGLSSGLYIEGNYPPMWIIRLALRRPYTVAVMALLIIVLGILSARRMIVDIFPAIDIPVVVVVWNYPGLSAEDMERRVVLISERAYSTTVNGIKRIESQSIPGVGLLKVYFEPGSRHRRGHRPDLLGLTHDPAGSCRRASSRPTFSSSTPPTSRWRSSPSPARHRGAAALRLRAQLPPGPPLHHPGPLDARAVRRQAAADHGRREPRRARGQRAFASDVVTALQSSNVIIPAGTAQIGDTEYNVMLNSSPRSSTSSRLSRSRSWAAPVFLGDVATSRTGSPSRPTSST